MPIRDIGDITSTLDNLGEKKDPMCPECEKHKKHVRLVENEGKVLECPECHYLHLAKR